MASLSERYVALRALEDEKGNLDPKAVVEAARDPNHPLHEDFEWDNDHAAEQHRLQQARNLIRAIPIEFSISTRYIAAPVYTHNPALPGHVPGYVRTMSIRTEEDRVRESLNQEFSRLESLIRRIRGFAEVYAKQEEVEQRLVAAVQPLPDPAEAP